MVCTLGLPRYTPTDVAAVVDERPAEPSATAAKASSQVASVSSPSTRTSGARQPVGVVVELAEGGALRADEPLAEDVVAVAAGAGDPAVLDGERQAAGGLAQRADPQGSPGHFLILRRSFADFIHRPRSKSIPHFGRPTARFPVKRRSASAWAIMREIDGEENRRMVSPVSEATDRCGSCGNDLRAKARFCDVCGSPVSTRPAQANTSR